MKRLKNILSAVCSVSLIWSQDATEYHAVLWGMYSVARGTLESGILSFEHIVLDDTASVPLTKAYIAYAYQAKQYSFVVHKQTFIKKNCADDTEMLLMLARSFEHLKRHHEADACFAQLEKKYPDNAEIMYHAMRAHIRGERLHQALACADTFIEFNKEATACAVFYYIQAQVCQLLNKHDQAIAHLEKCIALSPRFEQGWFLWALLHEKMNKTLQVQRGYTQFLDIVGGDAVIEKKLLSLLLNDTAHAEKSWYDRAAQAFYEKQYSKALLFLDIAEKNEKKHDACMLLRIQILDILQRHDELVAVLKNILLKEPDKELWLRTFHALFLQTVHKRPLMNVLEEVVHKKPRNQRLILYALDCALRLRDYAAIMRLYKKLIFTKKDALLKAQVLYQVGATAYERHDWPAVRTIVHAVDVPWCSYAPLLNFAAYYYSKYEGFQDKAQQLVNAALALDPHNPHFKDTQAYIYVHMGKKKEAVALLQPLVHEVPLDKKIRRHRKKAREL